MIRLGVQLSVRSGREALVRLLLTVAAVAIGVTVLLAVLADYHAFQATSRRPSWESTQGSDALPAAGSAADAWNYSESLYRGRFIEVLDIAPLGPGAPVPPGIPSLPGAGEYYASPALAALMKTVPASQLGDRFPGRQIGTIGDAALSGPNELAIMVGYSPGQLAQLPATTAVTRIATAPQVQGTTNLYRLAFGFGAIVLLFPLLVLVSTATRLATARREERFAAMRLVGATPGQINVIASVDAVIGSLAGTLAGAGIFLAVRPALAGIALSGARFFPYLVTPTLGGYLALVVGVPIAAAAASLVSLRRVRISPLGVSRKVAPPAPRSWRLIPIAGGLALFIDSIAGFSGPTINRQQNPDFRPVFLGLILTMVGLVLSGPWLTMQIARLLGRAAPGPSSLLASRRLAANPKGGFRAVSGLVLAVFVGTVIAGLAPADVSAQSGGSYAQLDNVLRVPYRQGPGSGLPAQLASQLTATLDAMPGISAVPLYINPPYAAAAAAEGGGAPKGLADAGPPLPDLPPDILSCPALATLPALGSCPAGAAAVTGDFSTLMSDDNPLGISQDLPFVTAASPASTAALGTLDVGGLLVKAASQDALERARTYLTVYDANLPHGSTLRDYQMGALEPETFGEIAAIRNDDDRNINRVIQIGAALTVLVAGCSVAVATGGGLVERKRPFSLLRVAGAPLRALRNVILLEGVLPLVGASAIAAAAGFAVLIPTLNALFPKALQHAAAPGPIYYVSLAGGLAISIGVVLLTLPLLGRMTQPQNARFE
jgi:hypothetical protein